MVTSHPEFSTNILHDQSLLLLSPFSAIVPWIHNTLSSHWTSKVDPIGKQLEFLRLLYILTAFSSLSTSASLFALIGALLINVTIPNRGELNYDVAGLSKPGLSVVDLVCIKARDESPLLSTHFLSCLLYETDAFFHQSIALIVVWGWYSLLYFCKIY